MYKAKLWDEDKWNIHSSSYNSSKYSASSGEHKEDKQYHEQKYGSKEKNASSDYMKKEDQKDMDDKEKKDSIFGEADEGKNVKQEIRDEDIPFKAAKLVFDEKKFGTKKIEAKKDANTIEDAIKKAIEDEKKVIIMDN